MNWQMRRGIAVLCVAAALGLLAGVFALGGDSAARPFSGLATLAALVGLGMLAIGVTHLKDR